MLNYIIALQSSNPDSGQSTGDMTTSSTISRKGREKDERGTYGSKEI